MGIALFCRSSDIFLSHRENRLDFNSRPTLCRRFLNGRPIRPTAKEPQADPDRVRDQKPLPGTDTDREPEIPVGSGRDGYDPIRASTIRSPPDPSSPGSML